jgi:hypothetical protein
MSCSRVGGIDYEPVAPVAGGDWTAAGAAVLAPERLAEARDVHLERLGGGSGRTLAL